MAPEIHRQQLTKIPTSTYRLQFNQNFTLSDAAGLVDYLARLGITALYASPILASTRTSTHGYDVCDHSRIHDPLGNRQDLEHLCANLQRAGIGLIIDVVPNHMAADSSNPWWADVLENGQNSAFANYFDIEWDAVNSGSGGRVVLPVLGDHYGAELAGAKLNLAYADGAFFVGYYHHRFPVAARSFAWLLRTLAQRLAPPEQSELLNIAREVDRCLQTRPVHSSELIRIKRCLAKLHRRSAGMQQAIDNLLSEFSGDNLHALIQEQCYRLGYWRTAHDELNYRRFFDVAALVSLRVEHEEVFQQSHAFVMSLVRDGMVTGLRIDHPDGLWDPEQYFDRLQYAASNVPCFTIVEKILMGDETLPSGWRVHGTTGYDFTNLVNALFIAGESRAALERIYVQFTGRPQPLHDVLYASKKQVLTESFYSDLQSLSRRLHRIARATRTAQDFSLRYLTEALVEFVTCFPVYRTYITERTGDVAPADQQAIRIAAREAVRRSGKAPAVALIARLLLLDPPADLTSDVLRDCPRFVMRFQQLTGPAMAKGFEDTALYRYFPLLSLNEVGGNPDSFGITLENFHSRNQQRLRDWPHSLLATATHDTKRGEDIRARLNVLAEIPEEWRGAVQQWSALNASKKTIVDNEPAPSANDEFLFYQTLVGAAPWSVISHGRAGENAELISAAQPIDKGEHGESYDPLETEIASLRQRLTDYMLKAVKEAKLCTSWIHPNQSYESAVASFVEQTVNTAADNVFWRQFSEWLPPIAFFGALNSLSQTALKLTCPGVPDFYQGTELWDLSLVDPDNRLPVDFKRRRELLTGLEIQFKRAGGKQLAIELLKRLPTGEAKMFLIWRTLHFRKPHAELFGRGDYQPLTVNGVHQRHVCAFARVFREQKLLVVAPRLLASLTGGTMRSPLGSMAWADTRVEIPSDWRLQRWHNVLTQETCDARQDGTLSVGELLSSFPVAVCSANP